MRRKIKRSLNRALCHWACNGPAAGVGTWVLGLFGKKPAPLKKLQDVASQVATLAPASTYRVEAPRWNGEGSRVNDGKFPPILARKIKDVTFTINSSVFLIEDNLYVSNRVGPSRSGQILIHDNLCFIENKTAVSLSAKRQSISDGILIGCSGATNWDHFVI